MARKPLRPLIRSGGFYPSRKWTPLVYAGGYTTANGGGEPEPPPIEKTVIGNPIHITDALAKPVQALSVKLEPIQAGSGDPSPDNVRPISGHTNADVIVSPTLNPLDGTTYPIPLGQTVYGCVADAVTGVATVTMAISDLGDLRWAYNSAFNCFYAETPPSPTPKNSFNAICSQYKFVGAYPNLVDKSCAFIYNNTVAVRDSAYGTDAASFKTAMSGVQLVYELATPITIQLTPQQVELLQGENNIWSDGTITMTYLADGNASDEEALNILLGGRYVNNHGEDEPTDREALDILLGR